MGNKLDRRNSYSAIPQLEGKISNLTKYVTVEDGKITSKIEDLYGDVSTITQTATEIEGRVEDAEGDISSLRLDVDSVDAELTNETDARTTLVRAFNGGVLTAYKLTSGNNWGVLTNADGSVDIVYLTWANDEPTITSTYASYGTETKIGATSNYNVRINTNGVGFYDGSTRIGVIAKNGTGLSLYTSGTDSGYSGTGHVYTTPLGTDMWAERDNNNSIYAHASINHVAPACILTAVDGSDVASLMVYAGIIDLDGPVRFEEASSTFVTETHSFSISSLSSGDSTGATTASISKTVPTGTSYTYYPIAVAGFRSGNGDLMFSRVQLTTQGSNSGAITYNARAIGSAYAGGTGYVDVLWVRT